MVGSYRFVCALSHGGLSDFVVEKGMYQYFTSGEVPDLC